MKSCDFYPMMAFTQYCPFAHNGPILFKCSFILAQDFVSLNFRAQEKLFSSLNIVCLWRKKKVFCFCHLFTLNPSTSYVSFILLRDKWRTPKGILILMWTLQTYITGSGQVLTVFLSQKWFHTVHDIIFSLLPKFLLLIT